MSISVRSIPRITLLLVLALVVLSMIAPASVLDFLRFEYDWVDRSIDFTFAVFPGADVDHLLAFALLGFVTYFGWSQGRAWQVALGMLCVGSLVEFVQLWIPGRDAAVSHAMLDMIGGMAGFGFAWVLGYAWGSMGLPENPAE